MTAFRLIADDLTGALDTAAEFSGLWLPLDVVWSSARVVPGADCLAIDSGTREAGRDDAVAAVERLAPTLVDAAIAFKKVDSLMRGWWAAELAACCRAAGWRRCVVAPAFPHQGRRTTGARQFARSGDGSWRPAGDDLVQALAGEGIAARHVEGGDRITDGVTVVDAQTDADLDDVARQGLEADGPTLWCGSGGLAQALARAIAPGHEPLGSKTLPRPVLGLFGSDQGATLSQLRACEAHWVRLHGTDDESVRGVGRRLDRSGVALVSVSLSPGIDRELARSRIAATLEGLTDGLPPPGTLIVSGGETLKAVCASLGTDSLRITGRIAPGVPCSRMQGGRWDGVPVVSKSGAFGGPRLWQDLLRENRLVFEGTDA